MSRGTLRHALGMGNKLYSARVKPRLKMVLIRRLARHSTILVPQRGGGASKKIAAKAQGVVVDVGPGAWEGGQFVETGLAAGQTVIYIEEGAFEITDPPEALEEELVLIESDGVFAVIEPEGMPARRPALAKVE